MCLFENPKRKPITSGEEQSHSQVSRPSLSYLYLISQGGPTGLLWNLRAQRSQGDNNYPTEIIKMNVFTVLRMLFF